LVIFAPPILAWASLLPNPAVNRTASS
jgi:hypothetical protein